MKVTRSRKVRRGLGWEVFEVSLTEADLTPEEKGSRYAGLLLELKAEEHLLTILGHHGLLKRSRVKNDQSAQNQAAGIRILRRALLDAV